MLLRDSELGALVGEWMEKRNVYIACHLLYILDGEVDIWLAWWGGWLAGVGILGIWRSSASMSEVDAAGAMGLIGLISC